MCVRGCQRASAPSPPTVAAAAAEATAAARSTSLNAQIAIHSARMGDRRAADTKQLISSRARRNRASNEPSSQAGIDKGEPVSATAAAAAALPAMQTIRTASKRARFMRRMLGAGVPQRVGGHSEALRVWEIPDAGREPPAPASQGAIGWYLHRPRFVAMPVSGWAGGDIMNEDARAPGLWVPLSVLLPLLDSTFDCCARRGWIRLSLSPSISLFLFS
jgi:hypothetical protein